MVEEKEQESVVEETKKSKNLICLFTEKTQLTDSVIPIRWCIGKDVFEDLKTRKVEKPHLLLVVVKWDKDPQNRKEVLRKLVPLEQMMEFIQFKSPGRHKIMAAIVWDILGSADRLKEKFLMSYYRNCYETNVLTYEKDKLAKPNDICRRTDGINEDSTIEIEVAEGFFAKKPSKRLSKWVNLFFRWGPVDQCDFRKRCLLAFSLQPIAILIWLMGKELITIIIGFFLLLCGIKGVDFSPARRPFTYEMDQMWKGLDGSIFFNKKHPFLAPFAPIFVLTIFIASLLAINYGLDFKVSIWKIMILSIATVVFLSIIITVFFYAFYFFYAFHRTRVGRKPRKLILEEEYENLSSIVCTGRQLEPSLAALPKEKRTIYLRFLNLKAKMCKPFAEH